MNKTLTALALAGLLVIAVGGSPVRAEQPRILGTVHFVRVDASIPLPPDRALLDGDLVLTESHAAWVDLGEAGTFDLAPNSGVLFGARRLDEIGLRVLSGRIETVSPAGKRLVAGAGSSVVVSSEPRAFGAPTVDFTLPGSEVDKRDHRRPRHTH
jgi:hypothetical protein